MAEVPIDERGIPTELNEAGTAAPHCPVKPCVLCTGHNSVRRENGNYQTSWEWCQEMDTCGATVDWDLIFEGR